MSEHNNFQVHSTHVNSDPYKKSLIHESKDGKCGLPLKLITIYVSIVGKICVEKCMIILCFNNMAHLTLLSHSLTHM